ncbi:MAG: 4Fe-4S dicluster domain-containing protein, partial [Clostridia bacterium]|nr:4Fe-4S dicluster domain-containing protein [Clostridia bacterium]
GDAVNDGTDIAIAAISHGKRAAKVIDSYLRGHMEPISTPFFVARTDVSREEFDEVESAPRIEPRTDGPDARKRTFEAYTEAFTPDEAMREASRCLECGCCDFHDCRLLPLLNAYSADEVALDGSVRNVPVDRSHPFIWRDENKCILCGLCVRMCGELVGASALGFAGRGFDSAARPAFDWPLLGHDCISCGHCAAVCPTGALQERRPFAKSPPLPPDAEPFVCERCPRGCRFTLERYGGRVLKAVPLHIDECCSIGRYMPVIGNIARLTDTQRDALEKVLKGDLRAYVGGAPERLL